MISGMDRYYQVVRCFRDEDLRADRQPEFTQLDIETSFMDEQAITDLNEEMIRELFKKSLGVDLPNPFPRLTYAEAMRRFGSDKPDLRIPLELVDVADLLSDIEFKVFAGPAKDPNGRVVALRLPNGAELSRKEIDDLTQYVSIYGAKGLAYIKVTDRAAGIDGLQSPIVKFLPESAVLEILDRVGAQTGDLVFFGADKAKIVNESMGALRLKVGHDRGLAQGAWAPLWVVDFPMFEWTRRIIAGSLSITPSLHPSARLMNSRTIRVLRSLALTTWSLMERKSAAVRFVSIKPKCRMLSSSCWALAMRRHNRSLASS